MRRGISLVGLVAITVLAACGGNSSTTTTATGPKTVKIAITGPFTGDASPIGLGALHGAQMAVDEWNAKNGINGTQIQVDVGDDAGKGDQGVTLANKYVADPDILGVIGPMFSGIALAELPLFERATLPMITESGSNPKITESGWKTAHRLVARDDNQGPADAKFALETLQTKKVFVLDSKTPYSQGLSDLFEKTVKAGGATTQRDVFASGVKDANPIATKIKAFNPDLVFFADEGAEAPLLLQALKGQGLSLGPNFRYMGGDGEFDATQFIKGSQGAAEGAYISNIAPDVNTVPSAATFVKNYTAKYKDLGPFDAVAYEATNMLLTAIKSSPVKSGKVDRADVNKALSTETYNSILGVPLKFDSKGDVAAVGVFIFQVKSGAFQQIKAQTA